MDIVEAISQRKSIRAFKSDPVPKEILKEIMELAYVLGGIVAGTRPAMDKGWVDEARMIGQSGRTVSPGLFVSLGASGAMHYTTGFMGSKVVLAVDQNPQAPVFQMADIGIVGDLREVIPCLIEELKKDRMPKKF